MIWFVTIFVWSLIGNLIIAHQFGVLSILVMMLKILGVVPGHICGVHFDNVFGCLVACFLIDLLTDHHYFTPIAYVRIFECLVLGATTVADPLHIEAHVVLLFAIGAFHHHLLRDEVTDSLVRAIVLILRGSASNLS